ncbi:hypothetical protein ACOT81_31935 [Streptomyces sp. WI04-05B]|uniref:hypothetical protein n=1 Tax=Streptomyces TaxID=1883 RepID=UPI0029AC9193|nr:MULTISPECIES: hypothetical protein [unclassified Streptomyces]MDX2542098.1 hypothetical protein [Streptomyces sp. WI04-05B]MDX2583930.1 hypothetical protein [Streptomyces sp. WI04-05A]MDX3750359.1 hypothetical protein [Streptomyces sp. AK08-02]
MRASAARNLPALLLGLREEGFSGTVRVAGTPGGTLHLRDGLLGAIETPGAPTATSALLTSGRIGDEDWLAACAAQRDAELLGERLVADKLVGAAELEVICTAAVFDAAFAMSLGAPGSWELSDPEPALLARPGVEPRQLTDETTRRIALLIRLWGPPGELARVRPVPGTGVVEGPLSGRHENILNQVNGRRTARDLAFALGRGLYAVMLDLIRMESYGLLRWEPPTVPGGRPSTAPRVAPGRTRVAGPPPVPSRTEPLPRRMPRGGEKGGK